jgi:Ni/Fe-hydrogenase subunit HybB-like protein
MGFAVNPLGQFSPPYLPSLTEVLIALGLLAVGLLLMTIAAKALPLRVPEEHGEKHSPVPDREPPAPLDETATVLVADAG